MIHLRRSRRRWRPVFALLLLAPLVGEFLLGNAPITAIAGLPFLIPLYGCGALLIREVARHTGRGWPTMLLLGAAYGLFEEGPVDQMLWNPHYGGFDFGLTYAGTHVPLLGTSVALLQDVVSMHMIWSICVPIALVESFRREPRRPWLGRPGLIVTTLVFVTGSVLLAASQYAANGHFMASWWQWTVGAIMIIAVVAAALLTGRNPRPTTGTVAPQPVTHTAAPRPRLAGCAAFALTSAYWVGQSVLRDHVPDWSVAAFWLVLAILAVVLGIRWSRRSGWGSEHRVAMAVGALLTYVWVGVVHAMDMGMPPIIGLTGNTIFGAGALILAAAAVRAVRRSYRHRTAATPTTTTPSATSTSAPTSAARPATSPPTLDVEEDGH
ncbi:hypothetical protein GCM10010361_13760 [Streptomyces olivaceiscleroticus]|uniref:DUF998 domain-containing protein n=1 Tax=Streptomyces olivaceiscleroticus TaxID=68245 RepID=A0ABN0ZKE2_9ACTN